MTPLKPVVRAKPTTPLSNAQDQPDATVTQVLPTLTTVIKQDHSWLIFALQQRTKGPSRRAPTRWATLHSGEAQASAPQRTSPSKSPPLTETPVQDKVIVPATVKTASPPEDKHEKAPATHRTPSPKQTPTTPSDNTTRAKQAVESPAQKRTTPEDASIKQPSKTRLFDSSDSDNDATFGGGKAKTPAESISSARGKRPVKTARVPASATSKALHNTKPSRQLFDDDDDDDNDLFATMSRKAVRSSPATTVDAGMF